MNSIGRFPNFELNDDDYIAQQHIYRIERESVKFVHHSYQLIPTPAHLPRQVGLALRYVLKCIFLRLRKMSRPIRGKFGVLANYTLYFILSQPLSLQVWSWKRRVTELQNYKQLRPDTYANHIQYFSSICYIYASPRTIHNYIAWSCGHHCGVLGRVSNTKSILCPADSIYISVAEWVGSSSGLYDSFVFNFIISIFFTLINVEAALVLPTNSKFGTV